MFFVEYEKYNFFFIELLRIKWDNVKCCDNSFFISSYFIGRN